MPEQTQFVGRLAVQQRVVPDYRAAFFDRLASACSRGLDVFAGQPRPEEGIVAANHLAIARMTSGRNRHLLRGAFYLCSQPGLESWLASTDPDALILEANPRHLSNRAAARWMRRRRRPVIGWGLGALGARGPVGRVRTWFRRRYLMSFDGLIAYSSQGAAQYRALGFPAQRVFVAANAVLPAPAAVAAHTSIGGRRPRLLFVGRLQARKRVDLLLRAGVRLSPPTEIWIAGDGPARADLERLARQLGGPVRFTGDVRGPELDALFDQADAFVLPGTGGLAVQQAMAHGLPVIVAEGDGTQNDLVSAANGWLIPAGSLEALKTALDQALSNPARLLAMGVESHRLAAERFNIDVMAADFVRALNAVAEMRT